MSTRTREVHAPITGGDVAVFTFWGCTVYAIYVAGRWVYFTVMDGVYQAIFVGKVIGWVGVASIAGPAIVGVTTAGVRWISDVLGRRRDIENVPLPTWAAVTLGKPQDAVDHLFATGFRRMFVATFGYEPDAANLSEAQFEELRGGLVRKSMARFPQLYSQLWAATNAVLLSGNECIERFLKDLAESWKRLSPFSLLKTVLHYLSFRRLFPGCRDRVGPGVEGLRTNQKLLRSITYPAVLTALPLFRGLLNQHLPEESPALLPKERPTDSSPDTIAAEATSSEREEESHLMMLPLPAPASANDVVVEEPFVHDEHAYQATLVENSKQSFEEAMATFTPSNPEFGNPAYFQDLKLCLQQEVLPNHPCPFDVLEAVATCQTAEACLDEFDVRLDENLETTDEKTWDAWVHAGVLDSVGEIDPTKGASETIDALRRHCFWHFLQERLGKPVEVAFTGDLEFDLIDDEEESAASKLLDDAEVVVHPTMTVAPPVEPSRPSGPMAGF